MKRLPIFLFSSAQPEGAATLEHLPEEHRGIKQLLEKPKDAGRIDYEFLPGSTLDNLYKQLNRFHNRLALFHFSGHSNQRLLALQDKPTRAGNTSKVLGMQDSLKLVFLNGCANADQVQELWKKGVKAIIATSCKVEDKAAMDFAVYFYEALVAGMSLHRAYVAACARLSDEEGGSNRIGIYRVPPGVENDDEAEAGFPWGLYVREEDEDMLDWTMPDPYRPLADLDYQTEVTLSTRHENKRLLEAIYAGMARENKRCALEWEDYQEEKISLSKLQKDVYERLPSLLGVHVRALFTKHGIEKGRTRLELINNAYRVFSQLMASMAFADFWHVLARQTDMQISAAYQKDLQRFLNMQPEEHASFDFLWLLTAIYAIRWENEVASTFPELEQLARQLLEDEEVISAYRFLESGLRDRLLAKNIASREVSQLCLEAEEQLGRLLGAGAFLINYQLVSINDILVRKRLRPAHTSFVHRKFLLHGTDATTYDKRDILRTQPVYNQSVVLTKNLNDHQAKVWVLAPFLVDQNAFKERVKEPKIYFRQGVLPDGRHQYLLAETLMPDDTWVLPPEPSATVEWGEELKEACALLQTFIADLQPHLHHG